MLQKIIIIVAVAGTHFAACKFIPPVVRSVMNSTLYHFQAVKALTGALVILTKILYFPIISLSLYSRHWFPGDLINIVIFANSLFWTAVICGSVLLYRKLVSIKK